MDRHDAYELLAGILARYQGLRFDELVALVGDSVSERMRTRSGEELLVNVSVAWVDDRAKRLQVTASADSQSPFRMERLEERIFVAEETA